ncbi:MULTISPECIES: MFS transporter [unclassified Pseudomonas]|uniref:MFS transporter n=1 Tax=unclassified Pseudomonas TaxID=196821 RepID=UPI002AC98904|nr:MULTISPECIES: MFS transporter [unclassified Pseudomonas]MEB0039247.1 MFS transporter [Pseudomonas sp. MH10]MEB0076118.1 MFS transporter [Pseudomonas sp. MH10out]MEB0092924.1 MFS transporter [Pseudomonas sp. CCI4.2]MEB0100082.1 MFS transporter [Pseudomonas sp. CCI3.2]MEB0119687.1 MFS transporter [Pseudomonas sp. CCI1.2]
MTAAVPSTADSYSRRAAIVLGLCLPSDTLLYLLLPMQSQAFGVTLAQAGVLLAANRLVRIFGYGYVMRFYARNGDRPTLMLASGVAALCALGNALISGFWWLLILRLAWGLCFGALNLSTQVLATSETSGAARRAGRSRALIAAGPMVALPLGALLSLEIGPRLVFLLACVSALVALWVARGLPSTGHILSAPTGRRFKLPDSVAIWSFVEGVALDGLFIFGLSLQAQAMLGGNAVVIAGILLALRYVSEMLLSPMGGRAAENFGALRMLVAFSILSGLALTAFGSHWLIAGAACVLILRALQLPLVVIIIAQRNPGTGRVQAIAANAVWRDIGAGMGPLLAGVLLPVASATWVYAIAGLAIALSAIVCSRQK